MNGNAFMNTVASLKSTNNQLHEHFNKENT